MNYNAVHTECRKRWGPANRWPCIKCGRKARDWAYDGTDPTELRGLGSGMSSATMLRYSRYPEFYMPLCRRCHGETDEIWHPRWAARRKRNDLCRIADCQQRSLKRHGLNLCQIHIRECLNGNYIKLARELVNQ